MELAANKFNALKQSGHWKQASKQDEKIIALQAKIKLLEDKHNKKSKNKTKEKGNQKKPAWLTTPPKDREPAEKNSGGKTYYWCACHRKWSLNSGHTTATCCGFGLPATASDYCLAERTVITANCHTTRIKEAAVQLGWPQPSCAPSARSNNKSEASE